MTPVRAIRQEKQIKSTEIRKEEIKLFLFVDNMILHTDILNTPQKKNKHLLQQTQPNRTEPNRNIQLSKNTMKYTERKERWHKAKQSLEPDLSMTHMWKPSDR